MAKDFTVCVGTMGSGIWRSTDGGESWSRARGNFPMDCRVYGVTAHPKDPACDPCRHPCRHLSQR